MLLFKNSSKTMEGVLNNAKHATDGKPHNVKPGDIILIAQTKGTLLPGQKPIRWIMNFVSCEEDVNNLSDKIWGKHWRYLINGKNVRSVEPFEINDIKVTSKNYDAVQTYAFIEPEDEKEVLKWISETGYVCKDDQETFAYEFKEGKNLEFDDIIKELDSRYSNTPEFTKRVVNNIKRPSLLSNSIKEKYCFVLK